MENIDSTSESPTKEEKSAEYLERESMAKDIMAIDPPLDEDKKIIENADIHTDKTEAKLPKPIIKEENTQIENTEVLPSSPSLQDIENLFSEKEDIFKFGSETEKEAVIKYLLSASASKWEKVKMKPGKFYEKRIIPFLEKWKSDQEKIQKNENLDQQEEEVKEEETEVKEKEAKTFAEETKSLSFQDTFQKFFEENPNISSQQILDHFLNDPDAKIPETTRKQFLEYQKLISFTSQSEAFNESDKTIVENAVLEGISSGKSIQTTVQELYESPKLTNEARADLAERYGIPELNIKPMKTESDVEEMAMHMDKVREKTEVALTQTKEAVKQIEAWKENVEEQSEELENEIVEIEARVIELKQRKENGEILTDEEEQELAKKKKLLGHKQKDKEQLEQQKKDLLEKEQQLKEEQKALEKQHESLTNNDGHTTFKLRSHTVFVSEEGGTKYNNVDFQNIPGVSKFAINQFGRDFEREYEKMTVFDAFGGEYGAAGKLFEGLKLGDNKTLHGKNMNIGGATSSDALLSSWGLKQQPGEIMSAHHQEKLYKIGKCLDGPGSADESLKQLGILDVSGKFNLEGWLKVQNYIKENINNENNLTFDKMSEALSKGTTEEKTS